MEVMEAVICLGVGQLHVSGIGVGISSPREWDKDFCDLLWMRGESPSLIGRFVAVASYSCSMLLSLKLGWSLAMHRLVTFQSNKNH